MKKYLLILVVLLIAPSCISKRGYTPASGPKTDNIKINKIELDAKPAFVRAEKYFQLKNYPDALRAYQNIRIKHPKSRAHQLSTYRIGTIYYFQEEYLNASREFEFFLAKYPKTELSFDSTYNLAASEYQLDHFEKSYEVLTRLKLSEVQAQGPKRAETVYQLAAQASAALGNYPTTVSSYSAQYQVSGSDHSRINILENIDSSLGKISSLEALKKLQLEITEPIIKNKISSRIATLSVNKVISAPIIEEEGGVEKISLPNHGGNGEKWNIGVILPLSGRMAPYGKRALEGILLASQSFNATSQNEIKLFIEDSNSNPFTAENAVDTLVKEQGVMAIIGPLSWKESVAVSVKAEENGVPNISLAAKEGLSDRSPYLFQNGLSPKVQLDNLVRYCIQEKQMKRFAVLAPNNVFGRDMTNGFWDAVEKWNGKIVGYQTYQPDDKDFQVPTQELAGLNPKHRRQEWVKIQEFIKEQKARTGKEPKIKLKTIVDFDAVFIPDNPKIVSQIAASLAYFDINVPLLGTTEWNSDQLVKRGGKFLEGALFPGGLTVNTKNPTQKNFIKYYADSYGYIPDMLSAQSYEAMQLVYLALRNSNSSSRDSLAKALAQLKEFESPLGTVKFESNRMLGRNLSIFRLESGNIIEN